MYPYVLGANAAAARASRSIERSQQRDIVVRSRVTASRQQQPSRQEVTAGARGAGGQRQGQARDHEPLSPTVNLSAAKHFGDEQRATSHPPPFLSDTCRSLPPAHPLGD